MTAPLDPLRKTLSQLEKQGVTKAQLARIAGTSYSAVHRYMHGEMQLTRERHAEIVRNLRTWAKEIRALCFTSQTAP